MSSLAAPVKTPQGTTLKQRHSAGPPIPTMAGEGWDIFKVFELATERATAADAAAIALYTETGVAMTGAELIEYSKGLDRALRAAGVGQGDKVMLVNKITAFAMAACLAVIRVGAVFIPNDPNDPAAFRAGIIGTAKVKAVMAEEGASCNCPALSPPAPHHPPRSSVRCVSRVSADHSRLPARRPCVSAETEVPAGVPVVSAPIDGETAPAAVWNRESLASIFFSSGSTGTPKGVQHSAKIWYEFVGCQHCADSGEGQYEQPLKPVTWCDGFWHGAVTWYSNWTAISDVFNAIPVIIIDHDTLMNPVKLQELRLHHGLTTMYFSPAHLRAIVEEQPETLSDLTLVYVSSQAICLRLRFTAIF